MSSLLNTTIEDLKAGNIKIEKRIVVTRLGIKRKPTNVTVHFAVHKDGSATQISKKIQAQYLEVLNDSSII